MGVRKLPNVIITGTPGCGKTSHAEMVAEAVPGLRCINVSEYAKENGLLAGFDESRDSSFVDEDRLLDELEPLAGKGGLVIDWHCCEIFPERWIDLVVVVRCNNTVLYNRLEQRGYAESKIRENVECEIMQVLLEEARESYDNNIVVELSSETIEDLHGNVDRIVEWIENWVRDHPEGAGE